MCSLDDEDDIEDEDDVSWKVRRAAAKLLSAVILNYADALSEVRTLAWSRHRSSALHCGNSWLLLTARLIASLQVVPGHGVCCWLAWRACPQPVVAPVRLTLGRCLWHIFLPERTVTWADIEATWLSRSALWWCLCGSLCV